MSTRHRDLDGYLREIDRDADKLTPPRDGAVFYTNGGRQEALRHVAREHAAGRPAVTLEGDWQKSGAGGTELGRRLDADRLFDRTDPTVAALEANEFERIKRAGPVRIDANGVERRPISLDKHMAAGRIWGRTSQSFAERASGEVTVVTNDRPIKEHSYFARHERATLIRNEKVTAINGVSRAELVADLDKAERLTGADRKAALEDLNHKIEAGWQVRKNQAAISSPQPPGLESDRTPWARSMEKHGQKPAPATIRFKSK